MRNIAISLLILVSVVCISCTGNGSDIKELEKDRMELVKEREELHKEYENLKREYLQEKKAFIKCSKSSQRKTSCISKNKY